MPYELTNESPGGTTPYITAPTAFTMLSLFNILRFPLVVLPKALRCVSEAFNAIRCVLGQRSPGGVGGGGGGGDQGKARALPLFHPTAPVPTSCSTPYPLLSLLCRRPSLHLTCSNLEGFLAQDAAPKHDEEGAPGGRMHKAGSQHTGPSPGCQIRVARPAWLVTGLAAASLPP